MTTNNGSERAMEYASEELWGAMEGSNEP